jgi:hypothetical protein
MANAQEQQEADEAEDAEAEQEDALANLDDAEEELDQARKEAEEQLAMEQLTKLADSLKTLSERQDKLVAETIDYDKKREADKPLTPAQRAGVKSLGRVETALRQEADDLTARLEDAPVFALILKRAAAKMDTAAERLQNAQPDDETQAAAQSAATRFKQLLEAIKPDKGKGGAGGGAGGGGQSGGGAGGGGGGDGITTAAQIKMLKLLQQEVNDRTEALDEIKVRKKGLTTEQEAEVARLQDDQRGIADLARDLTNPKHDDGEED